MTTTYSPRDIDVVLRDGSSVRIRAAKPSDEAATLAFLNGLSKTSRSLRFGGKPIAPVATARRWAGVEECMGCCVLAVQGGEVIGQASYDRIADDRAVPDRAEVGFTVADSFQGRGVGTLLLKSLAEAADAEGVAGFEAVAGPDNLRMPDGF